MKTFGSRLKAARKAAGLSQVQLARMVGMSQGNLSDIENDHVPTSTFTPKLAATLGIEALWLAEGRGARQPQAARADLHAAEPPSPGYYPERISPVPMHNFPVLYAEDIMAGRSPDADEFIWIAQETLAGPGGLCVTKGFHVWLDRLAEHRAGDLVLVRIAGGPPVLRRILVVQGIEYLATDAPDGAHPFGDDCERLGVALTCYPPPLKRPRLRG
ncbi:helix-turn-helix domain-containing protein [Pseudothauera nasutitermitis]|nr:helix-turn-helix transcriptional regulator [Pseudothauera nasutitermitis]